MYFTCADNCTFNGQTVQNGFGVQAFKYSSITSSDPGACYLSGNMQWRNCINGTLYGSLPYSSCTVIPPASCYGTPWGTLSHGSSQTAYQSPSVPYGSSCSWISQTRTCDNGVLSGSYQYASCAVENPSPPSCTLTTDWDPVNKDVGTIMRWSTANATSLSINNGIGSVSPVSSGSRNIYPQTTTAYTGTASGAGGTAYCYHTVNVAPAATASITASPSTVAEGEASTLSWSTSGADEGVHITGIGWVSASGSIDVHPSETTTYTLTAYGFGGDGTDDATVAVFDSCVLDGLTVPSGESATFYSEETVPFGVECASVSQERTCSDGVLSGSESYRHSSCVCAVSWRCVGDDGQDIEETDASCTASVIETCDPPQFCSPGLSACAWLPLEFVSSGGRSGHLEAVPSLVRSGSTSRLHWNVQNAVSCSITGPFFSSALTSSGSEGISTPPIIERTEYTLSCTGQSGDTVSETATVQVTPDWVEL